MGYLGNTPGESFISFAKQVFTIVNSQTAYTLDFAVVDENELRLVINNVVQEPGSGKAYTASGTTLTLASALTNGTDEMYCVFLGKARETVTVPTITKDKLNLISTSSSAGLEVKGDGTTDGTLQLNCSQNSHGIKLASPPHSAGQSYTLTFPQSISADTFLKTDGSGNLSFAAAGGTNTPNFLATMSATQTPTSSAQVLINFDQTTYDSASGYNTSSKKYVIPSAGYYHIYTCVNLYNSNNDLDRIILYINIGGSTRFQTDSQPLNAASDFVYLGGVYNCSANDDVEIKVYQVSGSGTGTVANDKSFFGGYKLIT